MLHYGDIKAIKGSQVPATDCVIGGSPYQDLSISGKRAGLSGERSGLFMEQIRVIKEMREYDRANRRTNESVRPRFMVWENVPGALSSNKGEDFRRVLEETAKIADETAVIPRPPKGKWTNAGCIMGDGWSIAWRVFDAQFWGVPQRRRRIALVADFGGRCSPEILFERKSVSGNIEEGGEERQSTSRGIETCAYLSDQRDGTGTFCIAGNIIGRSLQAGGNGPGFQKDISYTLTSTDCHAVCACASYQKCDEAAINESLCLAFKSGQGAKAGSLGLQEEVSPTLTGAPSGTNQVPAICIAENRPVYSKQAVSNKDDFKPITFHPTQDSISFEDQTPSLSNGHSQNGQTAAGVVVPCCQKDCKSRCLHPDVAGTICANGAGTSRPAGQANETDLCVVQQTVERKIKNLTPGESQTNRIYDPSGVFPALCSREKSGLNRQAIIYTAHSMPHVEIRDELVSTPICYHEQPFLNSRTVVRRLTPMECERLQGYPDNWTDIGEWTDSKGKVHKTSDSARYKALGNSIAIPPWTWVLKRLCACYDRPATMASLFDGISGFPLIWSRINGAQNVLWTSEIEEFPIAVCKKHFG